MLKGFRFYSNDISIRQDLRLSVTMPFNCVRFPGIGFSQRLHPRTTRDSRSWVPRCALTTSKAMLSLQFDTPPDQAEFSQRMIPPVAMTRRTCVSVSLSPRVQRSHAELMPSLFTQDAIGDQGGKVMATLPPAPETVSRRSDVQVEFVLVYTLMGYAVSALSRCART